MQVLQPTAYDFIPIFDFKRSWIPAPQGFPSEKLGVDPNKIINKLDREDFYSLVVDINLSPSLEGCDPINSHVTQVMWSHKGMLHYGRCILSLLTNSGLVTFYIMKNYMWVKCLDLSVTLLKHLEEVWVDDSIDKSSLSSTEQYNLLKKRVHQVKSTAIGWSPVMTSVDGKFSYFVTCQSNGVIMIWRLSAILNDNSRLEPKFIQSHVSKLSRICFITWLSLGDNKGAIIVGDLSGVIKLFNVRLNVADPETIEFVNDVDIWPDRDNIPVRKIDHLGDGPNLSDKFIIAIKGSFFIIISTNDDGAIVDRTALHIGRFNITGCVHLKNFSVILSSQKGTMTKVDIFKEENGKIKFESKDLTSNLDMSDKLCFGMGASRNSMIWIMVNSLCKPFDHLVLRDPTTVVLFSMAHAPDPLEVLRNNPSQSLTYYWDCFEILRMLLVRGKHSETEIETNNLLSQSTYDLCCRYWSYNIYSRYKCQGSDVSEEMKLTIKRFEDTIFAQYSMKVLQKLVSSDIKSLSHVQLLSYSLIYRWLKIFSSESEEDTKELQSLLDVISKKDDVSLLQTKEPCGICGENVTMKHWKIAQCDAELPSREEGCKSSGHCVPRCMISLLQTTSLPYRICRVCSSLANDDLVHTDEPICIFCHGILNLDERVMT